MKVKNSFIFIKPEQIKKAVVSERNKQKSQIVFFLVQGGNLNVRWWVLGTKTALFNGQRFVECLFTSSEP